MERSNCNTEEKKYTHLREKDRNKLEALSDLGVSVREMARQLGKHPSTIYRELKRGRIDWLQSDLSKKKRYRADVGQRDYEEKAQDKARQLKIGKDRELAEYIKRKIVIDKYSPDAVLGEIAQKGLKFQRSICTKTLYNYIDMGIFAGLSNENLWEKRKRRKRQYRSVRRSSQRNRLGRSIEERPQEINEREEYGHWEIDCIKGPLGSPGAILTLTERKTLEEIIIKLRACTQAEVKRALDELEREYGEAFKLKFKSITMDNGSEFLAWEELEVSIRDHTKKRTVTYYAHAYSSWERGSNENQNRMIRRFIAKKRVLRDVSDEEIRSIQDWMNNYPRKLLGYRSANEAVAEILQNNDLGGFALEKFAV